MALSPTPTRTRTGTATVTVVLSPTPTAAATATRTASRTPVGTATRTPQKTSTATATRTGTATGTRTRSATPTRTPLVSPSPTATPRTIGGEITAFGVARADGRVVNSIGPDNHGYPTFLRPASGFLIFVEAKPGISGRPVGTVMFNSNPNDPNALPSFQIITSRPLGNGSPGVCDKGPPPMIGGVPAVDPPMFGGSQAAANAIRTAAAAPFTGSNPMA